MSRPLLPLEPVLPLPLVAGLSAAAASSARPAAGPATPPHAVTVTIADMRLLQAGCLLLSLSLVLSLDTAAEVKPLLLRQGELVLTGLRKSQISIGLLAQGRHRCH